MYRLKEFLTSLLFRLFRKKHKNAGWTLFAPLKIVPEYTVDVEKGQVTGIVKHNEKVYLTVIVDVANKKTVTKGSLKGIRKYIKPFKKNHYIEMVKGDAEFLLEDKTHRSR
ncbi:hypothetical protein J7I80_22695 [Bacillus sp. ISL-41]|uniref:hypothetical protein n=1 Tax=Bacillus sp. ISL-41 TaxID=2819127 RepID=UPI001BE805D7|nr:hypothetical protein [Bacillus sp. ISL-41]MBT2645034.1 hypothetical protein [Bacillus sp. ISL-41]